MTDAAIRLAISVVGLTLLGVAIARHGIANAAALTEVLAVAGLFFGITAWRALRRLRAERRDE
jgi:hypothetical protein